MHTHRVARWRLVVRAAVMIAVAAGAIFMVTLRSTATEESRGHATAFHRQVEIEGRDGGEAWRTGENSPSAEQVANRAYPRNYVDDRRALEVHRAFNRVPRRAPRAAFRSPRAAEAAVAAAPGTWAALGPVTPNVAGEASQFFNPDTLQGPPTQQSGRVTALAADPACAPGNCRLWVAAAGGGIWRTPDALAAKPTWIAPPDDLPTNAFGSLVYDAQSQTLYAGSGEPNGSGDSEAGVGLFRSTDGGAHWSVVPGSQPVATNRSIGAVAVDPANPQVIYIGTDVARHGSASVNGGRRTPPNAPRLGVYKSTDGGATFNLLSDLSDKTPQNPTPPGAGTGTDWFQGGINKLELDPNDPTVVYAAVFGYGVWRSGSRGADPWVQVFHTINQTDFATDAGDSHGDRTEFDLVDMGATTRAYLGDASDDFALDDDDSTPLPQVWRTNDVALIAGDAGGEYDNAGWIELSNPENGTNGFLPYGFCQNGQCGYDSFVVSPPGRPDDVWLGGSMNYDELPGYAGAPPRSNGRAVIRGTNAGAAPADIGWDDMTAVLGSDTVPFDFREGLHPDQHAIAFDRDGTIAFVGSDGGVARVDVTNPADRSGACDSRGLDDDDLVDCKRLLDAEPNAIVPLNDGLQTIQFQSLSYNPQNPTGELLGGTQDNGTWSYTGSPAWFESVGGDGGQSGFDASNPTIRYHNYYDASPEVNYHGNNPRTWLNTSDPLQLTDEARSFYTPFEADPVTGGRVYTGLEHVWRSDDHGGSEAELGSRCNSSQLDPNRLQPCGDWAPIGQKLTSASFGDRGGQFVVATERAPSDANTLWAATRTGRVFISRNAGDAAPIDVSFTRIDDDSSIDPDRFVTGIAIDPANANHAFVSYTGYSAYTTRTPGHVFEVTYDPAAGTAAWRDLSRNLGDQPVTDIEYYAFTGDLYAATDFGVLRLADGSTQWSDAGGSLPKVAVYGLTLADKAGVLYAATHGRGAYALDLPKPAPLAQNGGTGTTPQGTTNPAGGTSGGAAAAGVLRADARADTKRPALRLRHVKSVRRGRSVSVRGLVTDAGGLRSVKVSWGDGKRTTVRVSRTGSFKASHRYRKAGLHRITVVATDKAGNANRRHIMARVLSLR